MTDNFPDIDTISPSITAEDWVNEAILFGKMFQSAQIGSEEGMSFVYLLSQKWIESWKAKVSFTLIEQGVDLNSSDIMMDIELPVLNDDLVDTTHEEKTENYEFLKSSKQNYQLFNVVAKLGIMEYIDYLLIKEEAWNILKAKYPSAIELKRIKFSDAETGLPRVEVKFPLVITND